MNLRECTVNWGRHRLTALALAHCSLERKRGGIGKQREVKGIKREEMGGEKRGYYTEFAEEFAYITRTGTLS